MTALEIPSGWTITQREISNGYWQVEARHHDGRSVSHGGTNLHELQRRCIAEAAQLSAKRLAKTSTPLHAEMALSILLDRHGRLTGVTLSDGNELQDLNVAWGRDLGSEFDHVTTNVSPSIEGLAIDLFFTSEIVRLIDEDGVTLFPVERRLRKVVGYVNDERPVMYLSVLICAVAERDPRRAGGN